MVITAIGLFITPPGRVAYFTNWHLWGFTKDQWRTMHLWYCLIFVITSVDHIYFNLKELLRYIRFRISSRGSLAAERTYPVRRRRDRAESRLG